MSDEDMLNEDPAKVPIHIKVKLKDGREQIVKVEAEFFGSLAVHHGLMDCEGMWCVTHRPSGLRMATIESGDDARKIAETLNNCCTRAMVFTTEEEILDAMPVKYVDWIKACAKARKYVQPKG